MSAGDWGLVEIDHTAIGSGSQYALGSLHSTSGHPIDRIQTAIDAAIEYYLDEWNDDSEEEYEDESWDYDEE